MQSKTIRRRPVLRGRTCDNGPPAGEYRRHPRRRSDLVQDENDPDAQLELKRVTNVLQHVAHDLQAVSLQGQYGNVEVIHSTDEHPYFVETKGWVGAADLVVGNRVRQSDGSSLLVIANADDKRPEGVLVFNFAVEGSHTYFVEDGAGEKDWAWVHNRCYDETELANLINQRVPRANARASVPYLQSPGRWSDIDVETRWLNIESKIGKHNASDIVNQMRKHIAATTKPWALLLQDVPGKTVKEILGKKPSFKVFTDVESLIEHLKTFR